MSEQTFIPNSDYLSSSDAALSYKCSKDYISRLCRSGKLKGQLIGRNWFIEKESFAQLLAQRDVEDEKRVQELREQRRREYGSGKIQTKKDFEPQQSVVSVRSSEVDAVPIVLSPFVVAPRTVQKRSDYTQAASTLTLAFLFVFGGFSFAHSTYPQAALQAIADIRVGKLSITQSLAALAPSTELLPDAQLMAAAFESVGHVQSDFFASSPDLKSDLFERAFAKGKVSVASFFANLTGTHTQNKVVTISLQLPPTPVTTETAATSTPSSSVSTSVGISPAPKVISRTVVVQVPEPQDHAYTDAQIQILKNLLTAEIGKFSSAQSSSQSGISQSLFNFGISQRIDKLTGIQLNSVSVNGISGLTDADIPDNITVSGYATLADLAAQGSGFSTTSADYYVHASTTIPKTYTNNTFTGLNTFAGFISNASSTVNSNFTITGNATTSNLYLGGLIRGAGLVSCTGSGDKLIWDSATGQFGCGTDAGGSGSGISALKAQYGSAQTGATQTLATSTTGTDFTITSAGDTHTFNLPNASAVNRGLLTPADWATFNSKQSALSFTYPFVNSAGTISLAFGTTTANTWNALQTFASGFLATASSTIGGGTQATGLTVSGGATTTGNALVQGTMRISDSGTPNTGTLYFGSSNASISHNSSDYMFTTGSIYTAAGRIVSQGNSEQTGLGVRYASSLGTYYIGATNSASPDLVFTNNGISERARLTDAGFFGVGTSTPTTHLSIQGNQYTSGTAFFGGAITATSTLNVIGLSTLGSLNVSGATTLASSLSGAIYGVSGALASKATSTPSIGSVLTYSGTLGDVIGGASGTFGIANTSITNAMLAGSIAYSKLSLTGAILNADLAGSITASKLVGTDIATVGTITSGTWSGSFGTVSGANLTNLTAGNIIGSHTLSDGVLSTNVPLLNASNAFSVYNTFSSLFATNASSTNATTTGSLYLTALGTSAGTFLAVDANGKVIATTTPSGGGGGGSGTVTSIATTYPLLGGTITNTGTLSLAFGTTTANIWSALQTFNGGASTTNITASGTGYFASLGGAALSSLTGSYIPKWNSGTFANSLIYDDGTHIGIGTASPGDKLQVGDGSSDIRLSVMSNTTKQFTAKNASGNSVKYGASTDTFPNAVISNNDDVALMTLLYGGNIGIGTTSPAQKLSVHGNGYISGTSFFGGAITATSTLTLSALATSAGTFLAVDASGMIIATTTPSGGGGGSGTVTSIATNNGLTGGTITGSGTIGLAAISANSILGNISGSSAVPSAIATSSLFQNASASLSGLLTSADWNIFNNKSSAGYPFAIAGNATSTLTQFNGGLTAFASSTIGAGGQATGLTVFGGATTTGNAYFGSKIGIGATAPSYPLDIYKASQPQIHIGNTSSILGGYIGSDSNDEVFLGGGVSAEIGGWTARTATPSLIDLASGVISFYTDSGKSVGSAYTTSERMKITSAGLVGIGTSTPTSVFSVQGDSYHSGTAFFGGAITATSTLNVIGLSTLGSLNVSGATTLASSLSGAIYGVSGALASKATSTPSIGSVLTYSGTLGDVIGGASGTFGIANTSITNAMLAGSIAYSKLSLTGAILNADLAGSITASKLVGTDIATVGTITSGTWQGTKINLAYGGTNADLSATGGASQVLRQSSSGAAITVGQLAASDLSNGTTGSGAVVLAGSPTLTGTTLGSSLFFNASSTIGSGAQAGGLTIFGGATTTGNALIQGTFAVTGQTTLATSLTGLLKASSGVVSTAAYTDFPTIAANTILANATGATAAPTAVATSSLFAAGTAGNVLTYTSAGTWVPSATTTFSSGLTYANGNVTNTGVTALGPIGQSLTGSLVVASSTTGTDFSVTGSGSTLTFNLPTASAANRGLLSSTDWTTFNNKGSGTVTSVSGTWPIISSGGNTPTLSFGGLSTSTDAVVGNIPYFSGANTFANVATSTPSIGSVLTYSGGTLGSFVGGSAGTFGIANTSITNAMLAGSIAYSKLSLTGAILNADLAGSIAYSKLSLTGAILNADLAGSITASKLVGTDIATVGTITSGTWQGTKINLAYGGTNADLSATGGASQVLRQSSSGAAITVGQLAASDLSNGTTGSGAVALAGSPTFTGNAAFGNASTTQIGSTGNAYFATSAGSVGVGTTTPSKTFSVQGDSIVSGTETVGSLIATSTLTVSGAATLSSTLGVTGLSTLTGGFLSAASSTVNSTFVAVGATTLKSTLNVTGATTLASSLSGVIYGNSGALSSVATSAPSIGSVLTYSGTLGTFVGGADGTFGIANTSITNAMLAGSIAYSKLSLTGAILNADLAGSIAYSKLSLTGAILNADLAGSIAYGKLSLTGAVLNADLAGSIAYSKLSLTGAILNADLAGSIAYSKLSLTGAILNADLAGSIAYSKLSLTGAILNADLAGSIAASKLVGTDIATVGTITSGTWNGTKIGISYGGTATSTFYNGGAVFYNSTLGTLSQAGDGSGFFWDETNKRLGLGTATPGSKLTVNGALGNAPTTGSTRTGMFLFTNPTDTGMASMGISASGAGFWIQSHDSTQSTQYPLLLNPSGGSILVGASSAVTVPGTATIQALGANAGIWAVGNSGGQGAVGVYDKTSGHIGAYLFSGNAYAGIATIDNAGAYTGNPINWTATNVGIGSTSPSRAMSIQSAVSTAQMTVAYDTTRYTDFLTNSTGDLTITPQGQDATLYDSNLWVCSGAACPTGTPTGTGNIIAETNIGIGTTTPKYRLTIESQTTSEDLFQIATSSKQNVFIVNKNGQVGIGTTTPTQQLSIADRLFVGAGGATGMGTATSTFMGDIKITGKLDVGTIDPVYTIDGVKYATYGHSTVGLKEEAVAVLDIQDRNPKTGKFEKKIAFKDLDKGSDLWLFYQVTDFGQDWKNLVINLTASFDGTVFYKKVPNEAAVIISASEAGEVSARFIANRFDSAKWPNVRPDQDGDYKGHEIQTTDGGQGTPTGEANQSSKVGPWNEDIEPVSSL